MRRGHGSASSIASSHFLATHPETAKELLAKELKRRERKANKADEDDQADLFSADADPDADPEADAG